MIKEIRLSGSGGQGILFAGDILAEAAAIYEGKSVAQNTAYGGQVRGGASKCEVLIGDPGEEIEFPEVIKADILLAMNQESADRFAHEVKDEGVMIVDASQVNRIPEIRCRIVSVPITEIAREAFKSALAANMVALGVLVATTGAASVKAIEQAIDEKAPRGTSEMNKKAFLLGIEAAKTQAPHPHPLPTSRGEGD
jgi:2-oxoglutarate ferredoxin oxidoreductase subunit gamma